MFQQISKKKSIIILISLLILGTIFAIFNTTIILSFAGANKILGEWQKFLDDSLLILLVNFKDMAFEIIINMIQFYSLKIVQVSIMKLSIPLSTFSNLIYIPPNTGIFEVILGYGLIIYSLVNLIVINFDLSKVFSEPLYFQITHIIISIVSGTLLVGLIFYDHYFMGISGFILALCISYLATST